MYFETELVSEDTLDPSIGGINGSGSLDVGVPDELFAEKPFDERWVNALLGSPVVDQCSYRQRRIFAYTLQPIVFLAIGVLFVFIALWRLAVIAFALSVGLRNIDFKVALNRHARSRDITYDTQGSVFVWDIRGFKFFLPLAVSPLVLLIVGVVALIPIGEGTTVNPELWLRVVILYEIAVAIAFAIAQIVGLGLQVFYNFMMSYDTSERDRQKKQRESAAIDELICNATSPNRPDIFEMPFSTKYIPFYALAIKQKVCRSFSIG